MRKAFRRPGPAAVAAATLLLAACTGDNAGDPAALTSPTDMPQETAATPWAEPTSVPSTEPTPEDPTPPPFEPERGLANKPSKTIGQIGRPRARSLRFLDCMPCGLNGTMP